MLRSTLLRPSALCALLLAVPSAALSQDAYPTTRPSESGRAFQPGLAARTPQLAAKPVEVRLERLSAAIPWPRGLAFVDGELVVLARGRHRNYGGPAPEYEDYAGHLYRVDPTVSEPYEAGRAPGPAVRANGSLLAEPDPSVVHLFDRSKPVLENALMNRPYCTLAFDELSRNLVFCAYSGVDTKGNPSFRKNATDALYRYDLRSGRWGVIEMHDPAVVPASAMGPWISNEHYPHHDPRRNPPPHGLLNGPNGCAVAGRWLYAVGKDNHTLARYDLDPIRRDPEAGAPPAEVVLGERVRVRLEGKVRTIPVKGHSAVAAGGGFLYLGSRTSSLVLRFPLRDDGALVEPIVGELVAEFEPWSSESGRSADLWDLAVNAKGELFVSCARQGRVWRFRPDPSRPFDGDDQRKDPPTPNHPYLDMPALTGVANARISNLAFDDQDRLVFCVTMTEESLPHAGGIFRVADEG